MLTQTPVLPQNKRFRIGPLLVSGRTRSISEGNDVIPLPPKAVEVLLILLANAGETVSRVDLKRSVWGDESTDDGNVSKNIYVLRNALREKLGDKEFITTQSGRGYTYIGPVESENLDPIRRGPETVWAGATSGSELEGAGPPSPVFPDGDDEPVVGEEQFASVPKRWTSGRLAILLSTFVLLISAAFWVHHRREVNETFSSPAHPGDLVTDWRPVTYLEPEDQLGAQALSPGGALVAYRERSGVYVRDTKGGDPKRLNLPDGLAVDWISWFPDESKVLVSGERAFTTSSGKREAWIAPTGEGRALPLLEDAYRAAVSPDGKRIAYARASKSELWLADADGKNLRRLRDATSGDTILSLLWSPQSDRVVIDREHVQAEGATDASRGAVAQLQQQHQWTYESYSAASGKLLASKPDLHFESGALLPDGRLLYPAVGPSGVTRVAALDTTARTGAILPAADKFTEDVGQESYGVSNLTASRDGKQIALTMERRAIDVYSGSLRAGDEGTVLADVQRVTRHTGTGYPTSWTPNGDALLFDDGDTERSVIALAGPGNAIKQVADTGGRAVQGQYTPDGRWILFLHYEGNTGKVQSIDRVPVAGGPSSPLIKATGLEDFHCSRSTFGRCLFRVRKDNREYAYVEFDPDNGSAKEVARRPVSTSVLGDWSLSPDGLTIATSDHDTDHPAIQLFALPPFGNHPERRIPDTLSIQNNAVIPVPGYGTILGPSWDAEGNGFFVSAHSNAGYFLLRVDRTGTTTLLMRSVGPIWGVPSRDGKKLAFPSPTSGNTNIWLGHVH